MRFSLLSRIVPRPRAGLAQIFHRTGGVLRSLVAVVVFWVVAAAFPSTASVGARPPARHTRYPQRLVQTGLASFYGPGLHRDRTASGERFDQRKMLAAHRSLPLGTLVRVTNLENGRSVVVRVIDRGPFGRNRR